MQDKSPARTKDEQGYLFMKKGYYRERLGVLLSEGMDAYVEFLEDLGAYDEISRADTLALKWKQYLKDKYKENNVD